MKKEGGTGYVSFEVFRRSSVYICFTFSPLFLLLPLSRLLMVFLFFFSTGDVVYFARVIDNFIER